MPARPAPRDPVPYEPAPLDAQLASVLRAAGAHAARAVDGRRAVVLAEVGLAAGDDVAALVQLARAAGVLAAARGEGLDDLVVSTGRSVHVLRECDQLPGVVLHVRMDRDSGDVGAARRALASRSILQAVRAALTEPASAPAPLVAVPLQRAAPSPSPVQRPLPPVSPPPVSFPSVSLEPVPRPRVSEPTVQEPTVQEPTVQEPTVQEPTVQQPSGSQQPAAAVSQPAVSPQPARPALPVPVQRRPSEGGERQPALVTLTGRQQAVRTGALAVLALPPVPDPAATVEPEAAQAAEAPTAEPVVSLFDAEPADVTTADAAAPLDSLATGPLPVTLLPTLPRRRRAPIPVPDAPAAAATPRPAVLQQSFASDIGTMRRLLDGLRQLA